ncbi:hypothetical protein N0B51_04975 [Tsuneonella sp. YG55]|uniref:Uncharacterized protein n=1 Tax=Tsuneonella litorea TaxID=2976475 RepID=A0A9X2VZN9_9SPHN|nr:hypothetical protein [Tsuneonella litorea]MCT2558327.1 hypothetical protein [Tsuneonella litorea]
MLRLLTAAGIALIMAVPVNAQSTGPDSPTIDLDNPGSCQGAERAKRNSPGGDREYGGLDDELVPFVDRLRDEGTNFGTWLVDIRPYYCEIAPYGTYPD